MAKNKVQIDVKVDDKGTTKKVGLGAKKAADGLDKAAKSARTADRNLKGAAQASSNSTKNFSKMAQGISGGLVPAYAALAAQIFALTAAFNFLRNAADLERLRDSQVSYATATGIAIQTATTRIRQASQGMLGFQEAAQSAAIGAAKGFSTAQLEKLAIGAGKASAALGRNYQDTFDRLVRGVSKAEPELLDELGITLRLEDATNRYAQAIGTTREKLTTAQRSQAVYNETLRQLNENFGMIGTEANPFVQLSKTFEELQQKITSKILPVFVEFANVINKNADAAVAAFAGLGAIILLNIGIFKDGILSLFATATGTLSGFASLVSKIGMGAGKGISAVLTPVIDEIEEVEKSLQKLANDVTTRAGKKAQTLASQGVKSKTVARIAAGEEVTPQALGRLKKDLARVRQELVLTGETTSKAFAGATLESVKKLEKELKDLGRTGLTTGEKIKKAFAKGVVGAINVTKASIRGASIAFATFKKVGVAATSAVAKGFRLLGRATVFLAVLQTIIEVFEKLTEAPVAFVAGVENAIARLIQVFGFFVNLAISGANSIISAFGGAQDTFSKVAFSGREVSQELAKSVVDFGLESLDISRSQLQEIENQNAAQKKLVEQEEARIQKLKQAQAIQRSMLADISSLSPSTALERANAVNTLDIGQAIEAYQTIAGDKNNNWTVVAEAEANLRKFGKFIINLFPRLNTILMANGLDPHQGNEGLVAYLEYLQKIVGPAASAFASGMSSIKSNAQNLISSLQGGNLTDALSSLNIALKELQGTSRAGGILGDASEAKKAFIEATGIEDPEALQKTLEGYIAAINSNRVKRTNIGIARANKGPGSVGRQQELGLLSEEASLALSEKRMELEAFIATNAQLMESDRTKYDQEILQRTEEIRLLQEKAKVAKLNMTEVGQLGNAIGDSLASSMEQAFNGLIQGTMSAKDAFASMAKSMLQSIAKVISELLVAKILTASLGGTGFGNFLGIPKGRQGGMFEPVPGYAAGGIARGRESGYPAILHGTEAVVPLPNGNAIPVEFKQGGGSQMNNVTVNVSIDNDGNAQQSAASSNQQGMDIGNVIAAAVQRELQNQKRSGGILNPYGTA